MFPLLNTSRRCSRGIRTPQATRKQTPMPCGTTVSHSTALHVRTAANRCAARGRSCAEVAWLREASEQDTFRASHPLHLFNQRVKEGWTTIHPAEVPLGQLATWCAHNSSRNLIRAAFFFHLGCFLSGRIRFSCELKRSGTHRR